jgi:hypothetical protein
LQVLRETQGKKATQAQVIKAIRDLLERREIPGLLVAREILVLPEAKAILETRAILARVQKVTRV